MCDTKFATHLLIIFVVWCFFADITEATIERLDYAGVQFTPTQAIPMLKHESPFPVQDCNWVIVRGDLVDTTTGVTAPSGIPIQGPITRTGGGGLNTSVGLHIFPTTAASNGIQEIKLRYAVEFAGPDVFKINVFPRPRIDTITVSPPGVAKGTQVTITAKGSGLAKVHLNPILQDSKFNNFQGGIVSNDSTYSFFANADADLTLRASDFFNFVITGAGIPQSCSTAEGSGQLSYTLAKPDLVASKALKVYRLGPSENCNGQSVKTTDSKFCTELAGALPAPTQQNPHIEQLRNVGGIIYVVVNPTPAPIVGSFKVQLKSGINVLKEDTVNGLEANGRKILGFSRPENRRKLMRDLNCPSCYDLNVAPFNWVDPQYTVVVDVDNQINEASESNNTSLSD